LVDQGMDREAAYRAVQRAAADSMDHGVHFRERMWEEISNGGLLSKDEFWAVLSLRPFIEPMDGVFARLEKLEIASGRPSEPAVRPDAPWADERTP